ncbi:MAG TPA: hypothetical protein DCY13_18445, partial [Verrucomicrobiales bacterium]|nr:hypothetical protein [Verrucomicrobiales bacterium]
AALLALVLLAPGCSKEGKAARHLSRADEYFVAGDYDKARIEYLNAAQLQPTNAHAVLRLGTIFFEGGALLQAASLLDQAAKLGANAPELHARLGAIHAARGNVGAARNAILKALDTDPAHQEALLLLSDLAADAAARAEFRTLLAKLRAAHGRLALYDAAEAAVLLREQDADGALRILQPALQSDDVAAAAHFILGGVHLSRTNLTEARSAFAKSAELSPPRSGRQIRYANLLLQTGATNEGRAHLDGIISAAPDFVPARLRKAQLAFAAKDFETTKSEISAILNRDQINVEARQLEAQMYLATSEPAKAELVMGELIKLFPNVAQLHYQAAIAHLANQKTAQAVTQLERANELNPALPEVVLLLGRLKLARGEVGAVTASAQNLITTNPQLHAAYLLLGDAQMAAGDASGALATYQELERRFAEDPAGPHLVGATLLRQGQPGPAREAFERALQRRPTHFPSLERLVELDLNSGNNAGAEARLVAFLSANPAATDARLLLASVHVSSGQLERAEQELEQIIEELPELERAYLLLAEVYRSSQRQDEAILQLKELLGRKPTDFRALMMLGLLHTEKGNFLQAADDYEALLKTSPNFSPALNNLAYLYSEKLKNLDRAYELARKSRELLPNDPRIADTLGWIMYLRGEYPEALIYLQESVQRMATNGEVQYHLGMAHYAMGHEAPARAALEAALALDQDATWNPLIRDTLLVLESTGSGAMDSETLKRLEQTLKQRPRDMLLMTRIGRAYEAAGRLDDALDNYERAAQINAAAIGPMMGQARIKLAKGDSQQALAIARRVRDLARNDSGTAFELGQIARQAGDYPWSHSLLQEAVTASSNDAQVQFAFAQSAIAVGRLDPARTALELAKDEASLANRANTQLRLIALASADAISTPPADVRQFVDSQPKGELLPDFVRARLVAATGQFPAAIKAFEQILAAYPQFTPAMRSLAVALAATGQLDEAEKWARQARDITPNDGTLAKVLGQAAMARKDFGYAGTMLQEATRTLAGDGEAFLLLGEARVATRQVADARQALDRSLSLPLTEAQKNRAQQLLQQLNQLQ